MLKWVVVKAEELVERTRLVQYLAIDIGELTINFKSKEDAQRMLCFSKPKLKDKYAALILKHVSGRPVRYVNVSLIDNVLKVTDSNPRITTWPATDWDI